MAMTASATYKTRQREQILDCLIKNKDHHLTADEIMLDLNTKKVPVGRTTVYRYLDKLVSQGIVRRYFIEEGKSACYQYMEPDNTCNLHYHLKCTGCGHLFHLQCEYLRELDSHIKDRHAFSVDHSKTVLYGRCSSCEADLNRGVK